MARRAAELKAQLAVLVSERADVREALEHRLARFRGREGNAGGWRELDALIQRQHWRIAYFRAAADDINYRRFFNINDLAGLRVELPEVFDHAHQRILRLVKDGVIDGLRIDHIDGLLDPKGYLQRLQRRVASRRSAPSAEQIPSTWSWKRSSRRTRRCARTGPTDGTTGYDFLNQMTGLLVDSTAQVRLHRLLLASSPASSAPSPRSGGCASCTSWTMRCPVSSTCSPATWRDWRGRIRAPPTSRSPC